MFVGDWEEASKAYFFYSEKANKQFFPFVFCKALPETYIKNIIYCPGMEAP